MKEEVGEEHPDKSVTIDWLLCDLSSFRSIKEFVTAFKDRNLPLNILINNAGVAWLPFSKISSSELQFIIIIVSSTWYKPAGMADYWAINIHYSMLTYCVA